VFRGLQSPGGGVEWASMIRNILLDWSGTLVDDLPAVWKATNYVLLQAGLEELPLARFRAEFCLPFKKFYDRLTPNVPMQQLEEWFHGHFRQAQESITEIKHAREFLSHCQAQDKRMFVLSTMHPEHFHSQAAATGFAAFFERVYVGILDKQTKILDILRDNQLDPAETLFVGDMQHDIETAKHGGVFSCAVLTGYSGLEQLRASGPDLIVEHLGELQSIMDDSGWMMSADHGGGRPPSPQRPTVTVGALIYNAAGQVLLLRTHKWSNLWGIPGGKVRFGEPCIDALRRELKEETDLEVDDIRFVLVQDCIHSTEFYRDDHFVLLNYTCRATADTPVKLNDEAQEFAWVSLEQSGQLPLNAPTRVLLDAVRAAGRE
jgi:phosphoglycolate phosphatase